MARTVRQALLVLLTLLTLAGSASTASAGWGHRWGPWGHHHWGARPVYGAWGWPAYRSYSYTSLYVGLPRYRYYAPSYYYPVYSYPAYSVNYYVPTVSYSVSVPTYYYQPSYYAPTYCAPTTYIAPITYPSSYCDPCASLYPSSSDPAGSPTIDPSSYSTGIAPAALPSVPQQVASSSGSMVDRMLASRNSTYMPVTPPATRATATRATVLAANNMTVRPVSTAKPIVGTLPASSSLEPIPEALMQTADQMFAMGGYEQAASAYARLAVRYGNHDELTVRRFIALVASGQHNQAAVVFQLAQANQQPLSLDRLPNGSLTQFYGSLATNKQTHTETLAGFAMKSMDDSVALAMVGKWLELDQQPERAAIFVQRAAQMNADSGKTDAASPASGTLAWIGRD